MLPRKNIVNTFLNPGRPGPDAIVMAQGDELSMVVEQIIGIAGVKINEGAEPSLLVTPPVLRAPLARDTRAYVLALKNLFLRFGRPVFSWIGEEEFIQAGEDFSAVFSPAECARITQATRPDYEFVARRHGLPLLPDYAPDPAWRPFAGLRREQVCRLMDLHSPDFGGSIQDFLAILEPRLLTAYEQEIFADFLPRRDSIFPAAAAGMPVGRGAPKLEEGETHRPKVSVLTPTYNQAAFIRDCIEGVLTQKTLFPIEHVIADDGSTDGTQEIIRDYASRHPQILPVMHQYHVGGYVNHRDLFQMARGPYVALCDGDDYFTDPLKLQTQADLLDARPDLALCFHLTRVSYQDVPGKDWVYPPRDMLPGGYRPRYALTDLMARNLMQTSSVMYRWRFGPVLPDWFILATMPSDWYLHLLHAEQGDIGFIDKVMSVYRRHGQATYYTSEVNRLEHRHRHGLSELYTYEVVNRHFKGKCGTILRDLAGGVFVDLVMYATKSNDKSVLDEAIRAYPEFAEYMLKRIGIR
jgi:glycosyltransferase involved in cell wall biosynthesis